MREDRRVTAWGKDGKVEILLFAEEVPIRDLGVVLVYGLEVHVIYPSEMKREPAHWAETLQISEKVESFLRGLKSGMIKAGGPDLELPAIDSGGRPLPLPDI